MKKRYIIALFLAALFALAVPLTAVADVLIEPRNDFFERHINEIEYQRRDYFSDGKKGFVSVVAEPGSSKEIATIENGELHQIQYIYDHDGEFWGVFDVEIPDKPYQDWRRGWVAMDDFLVVYDSIAFEEEHADEIFNYTGSIDALFEVQELVFWKYPGSGVVIVVWDESMLTDPDMDFRTWWNEYPAYTDEAGREWIAFPSMIKTWMCLSDPSNDAIPAFNPAPAPGSWLPDGTRSQSAPSGGPLLPLPVLIISAVVVLAVVTVVLIRVLGRGATKARGE